jgi:subfamily B ATP-binding cassette protein MsbA
VSGEKRRDFRRWLTAAMAVTTVALCIVHFQNREKAMRKANIDVVLFHKTAVNAVNKRVMELRAALDQWTPGSPKPDAFSDVVTGEGMPDPIMERVTVPEKVKEDGKEKEVVREFWVHTSASDISQTREASDVELRGDSENVHALSFAGEGTAKLVIRATLLDPPVEGAKPVVVQVLVQRNSTEAPVPLLGWKPEDPASQKSSRTTRPLEVSSSTVESANEYSVAVGGPGRCDLILRIDPDRPPVKLRWTASLGKSSPQFAMGVNKDIPEGRAEFVSTDEGRLVSVFVPAQKLFVRGYVPIDRIAEVVKAELIGLDPTGFGDRLYLTDASGIVVVAVPSYPEKVKRRALDDRRSLSSKATQLIKVRNGGAQVYEGFGKDQVIGAFAPVDALGGGIIVEREEKRVLEAYRGVQWWHVSAAIFGILILIPLVGPVARKIREDTELPRLLAHARPFIPHIAIIVVAAAAYSVGNGIFGYQGKIVMDEVLVSDEGAAYERLRHICWVLAAVAVGMFAANWVKEYLSKFIQNRLIVEIRCVLCEKIAHLPMGFHSRQRAGDLLSRIQNDVAETNRGIEMLFGDVISDPILILGCITTAFVINWRLALVVFVGMPVVLVPISYFGRSIKKYARRRQLRKADVTHTINQMLSGIRVVKAFRMEDHEARRIRTVSQSFLVEAMKVARAQVTGKEFLEFFSKLSTIVITGLGGYLVLERQVSLGDLSAFGFLIAGMYRASKSLTTNYNKMQESLAGTERIFEILDTPDTMADRPSARALVRPRGEIAFEGVSFRYVEDGPWVLRDLSFRVPVGSSVALVGATGAGKSTILDLVARFYDPQKGRVSIDGMDLRDFSRDSLLAQIAIVTQEPFLFNATIAENLLYGKPGAARTEVEAAARAASVHDEILRQELGYDTVVGERGGRLSGGQRQRVTIARAILKDPPILLLDEATSALDSRAEQKVQEALYNLMKDRTTFVIAHRLSTIQGVDRILVLEGGTIVEQGTHRELLAIPNGHYRRLHDIQFAAALRPGEPEAESRAG